MFCQIIGVEIADEGAYSCVADNGRGVPPQAQVTLAVDSPTRWGHLFTPPDVPIGSRVLEEAAHLPDLGSSATCSTILIKSISSLVHASFTRSKLSWLKQRKISPARELHRLIFYLDIFWHWCHPSDWLIHISMMIAHLAHKVVPLASRGLWVNSHCRRPPRDWAGVDQSVYAL